MHEQKGNQIDDKGASALGEALKYNTTLVSLDLHGEKRKTVKTCKRR